MSFALVPHPRHTGCVRCVRIALLTLAFLFVAACSSSGHTGASTSDVSSLSGCPVQHGPERYHGGIVSIALRPWPKGPNLVVTSTQDTFIRAVAALPVPLPEPVAQPSACCPTGNVVDLGLSDGYHAVYGPCRLPPKIESARVQIAAIPGT